MLQKAQSSQSSLVTEPTRQKTAAAVWASTSINGSSQVNNWSFKKINK